MEIVSVTDHDRDRARRLAEATGARTRRTFDELIAEGDVDAVVVATPPGAHAQAVIPALEAGLGVFVEKPLARAQDDADAITEAAERTGQVCGVGYQWRSVDAVAALARELAGQETRLLLSQGIGVTQARPWFLDAGQSGRLISERASHHIDLQRMLGGEVVEVQASGSDVQLASLTDAASLPPDRRLETTVSLALRFASGALGAIHVIWTQDGYPSRHRLTAFGSDSSFELELDPEFRLRDCRGDRVLGSPQTPAPFAAALIRFVEATRRRDPDAVDCTPREAAGTLSVALACERALATYGTVPAGRPPPRGTGP